MKRFFLIMTLTTTVLFSCSKQEGEGGRSSITGKIHMTDNQGLNSGIYDMPDYDVYIIYGDENDIYDDDMKTNYDGRFEFKNLRKGSYRLFVYTQDLNEPSLVTTVFKAVEIGGNEQADVGTFEVER